MTAASTPSNDPLHQTISAIHDSPTRVALAITGGGSGALTSLLAVPGASRTVLEGQVPYAASALTDYLGNQPDRFCDDATALAMGVAAFQRATILAGDETSRDTLLGLGATASLTTERPKRGDHRALITVQTASSTTLARLDLAKDARTRAEEENLVTQLVIDMVARAAGVPPFSGLSLSDNDNLETRQTVASPELAAVWNQQHPIAWSLVDGGWSLEPTSCPVGVLSGSFAPRHRGHVELQQAAESILEGSVCYELTAVNADKPPLDFETIERRREVFTDRPLAMTSAATFVEKSQLFPGATFVLGVDTAARVIAPRFYDHDADKLDSALKTIRENGCRFLVAGRLDDDGFQDLACLDLPTQHRELFSPIPADVFRCDVSSTAIRNSGNTG